MYGQLKEEIAEELDNLARDKKYKLPHKWGWTVNRLMSDVGIVGSADARVNGKGYLPEWSILTKQLVVCLRNERYTLRRSKESENKKVT